MAGVPSLSTASSSNATAGVTGDTSSLNPVNYTYSAPFAIGSGASSDSAAGSGGSDLVKTALYVGGALAAAALLYFVARRRKKP